MTFIPISLVWGNDRRGCPMADCCPAYNCTGVVLRGSANEDVVASAAAGAPKEDQVVNNRGFSGGPFEFSSSCIIFDGAEMALSLLLI